MEATPIVSEATSIEAVIWDVPAIATFTNLIDIVWDQAESEEANVPVSVVEVTVGIDRTGS